MSQRAWPLCAWVTLQQADLLGSKDTYIDGVYNEEKHSQQVKFMQNISSYT